MANQTRGTPGMMLLGFAAVLLVLALGVMRPHAPDEIQPATGLGDTDYYAAPLSEDDFFHPALVFAAEPKGIFRRGVHPVQRDDASMNRVALDETGRHVVYTDARPKTDDRGKARTRWYLKTADHAYIEFGERKYFETFRAPKE